MSDKHILHLLDERPLTSLSATELDIIAAHTANCDPCSAAFEAAQIAFAMLQERAASVVAPPPFFQTRVMVAIREQNQGADTFGILKMWQAAKLLLTTMAAVVVLLTTLTIYTESRSPSTLPDSTLTLTTDPTDFVLYGRDDIDEQEFTNSQVISDIYALEPEDSNGK